MTAISNINTSPAPYMLYHTQSQRAVQEHTESQAAEASEKTPDDETGTMSGGRVNILA